MRTFLLLCCALVALSAADANPARTVAKAWKGMPKDLPFAGKTLPAARTLVWANPGTGGKAQDAGNWSEGGKPATTGPDATSDLVLPESDKPYIVGLDVVTPGDGAASMDLRSVAIGRNAALDAGTKINKVWWAGVGAVLQVFRTGTLVIHGDIAVAKGGNLHGRIRLGGDAATVVVLDEASHLQYWHDLTVAKGPKASVTILAKDLRLADGLRVESGRLIIGPDSAVRTFAGFDLRWKQACEEADRRADGGHCVDDKMAMEAYDYGQSNARIAAGAELELMEGAVLGSARAYSDRQLDIVVGGRLLAGDKGRPLGRDARLELTGSAGPAGVLNAPGGLYVATGGSIVVTASGTARLRAGALAPVDKGGIAVYLAGADLPAQMVVSDLRRPGIYARDPVAARKALKSDQVQGTAADDGLFAVLPVPAPGGDGTIELVNGRSIPARILFVHPYVPLLIARPLAGGTLRSFPLALVQRTMIGKTKTEHNPKRALTADEEKALAAEPIWAEDATPGSIAAFAKEKWDAARTLVWARPGVTGAGTIASNWLEADGTPALDHPYRPKAPDMLLPHSDAGYAANQPGNRDILPGWGVRHLTVENNAGYAVCYGISGNLWMRGNANIGDNCQMGCFGSGDANRHTVLRGNPGSLAHWTAFDTGDKGSLEICGRTGGAWDRGRLERGTLVLSEGSHLGNGDRASYFAKAGTTTILLQDAEIGFLGGATGEQTANAGISGRLWLGTPEHPLTRDMTLRLLRVADDRLNPAAKPDERTAGASLVFGPGSEFKIHRAKPDLRVTFTRQEAKDSPSQHIAVIFHAPVALDHVRFDWLMPGGLVVKQDIRATWKDVVYGPNCASTDKLVRDPQ